MEYVEGETLKTRLTRGPVAPAELVGMAIQIADAVDTPPQDRHRRIADALNGLADLARLEGDYVNALSLFKQSLRILRTLGEKLEMLFPVERMAALIMKSGQYGQSVRLWGATQALRDQITVPRPPDEAAEHDGDIAVARSRLGAGAFDAAWAEGQMMGIDAAIDEAM